MDLLDRVRRTIRRHDLARPSRRVVVALSGGPDSMALLHLLLRLEESGELRVAGVAHFNHQLRPAAASDEAFCRDVSASVGKPFFADREAVAERARRERRSLEDAARTARHAFFERARVHFNADLVALGHTKDDQAETFLLRLLRGAGMRGLAAMHPRREALIRPLIECRRTELRDYLDTTQAACVHDESNDDLTIPRNRVRAELLPVLERFNPAIVSVLASEAEIAREAWQWMDAEAVRLAQQICSHEADDVWRLDADALRRAPIALARLVLHQAMSAASGGRPVPFHHVERALELSRKGGGRIDAPGHRVERDGAAIVLRRKPADVVGRWTPPARGRTNFFEYPLSIPGEVALPEARLLVSAEFGSAPAIDGGSAVLGSGTVALVRKDRCSDTLSVRNRRPGDRFRPLGLNGRHKKLQDFFVDRKVARPQRDFVPLVVDGTGRIVWVAGYALDEEFRVTSPAEAVVILRLKVLGGLA
jgi:tRNA(Ile)-lysidine synthase